LIVKKIILVVEDEPIVGNVCGAVLRSHNFDCVVKGNGSDGLEAYRERNKEICLVLSDVSMPLMGGIEMVRRIFEINSRANVILMSGYSVSEIVPQEIRRLCSVIQKPFTSGRLVEAVKKCLKYDLEHHPSLLSPGWTGAEPKV
jgi:two-component system cell cycle sensor histidine kinase/response regulator CckA